MYYAALLKANKLYQCSNNKIPICKRYDQHYNIVRNTPMTIAHLLVLDIYTGHTKFCTQFRASYHIPSDMREDEVEKTHCQLYHFSRLLFESVNLYGQNMSKELSVFHGLGKPLYFSEFITKFRQPVSTTPSLKTADQFRNGAGIILILKSGTYFTKGATWKPRYSKVAWISNHPHEMEYLFYGRDSQLEISGILEHDGRKWIKHQAFNTFQRMTQNQDIAWDEEPFIDQIEIIQHLISIQQKNGKNSSIDNISSYAIGLFDHFCKHKTRKRISIRPLPQLLHNKLLLDLHGFSLIPIIELFPYLEQLCLNSVPFKQLVTDARMYIEAVLSVLETDKAMNVQLVVIQSTLCLRDMSLQTDSAGDQSMKIDKFYDKNNTKFRKLKNEYEERFKELGWEISYDAEAALAYTYQFERRRYRPSAPARQSTPQTTENNVESYADRNYSATSINDLPEKSSTTVQANDQSSHISNAQTRLTGNYHLISNDRDGQVSIQKAAIIRVADFKTRQMHIFYPKSITDDEIMYRIKIESGVDNNCADIVIKSFPYSISFSCLPVSFRVITIVHVSDQYRDHYYASTPTEPITIANPYQMSTTGHSRSALEMESIPIQKKSFK